MKHIFFVFVAFVCWPLILAAQSEKQDLHDSSKWENAITNFELEDAKQIPPQNAILFVGSSSIRMWDLRKSFPDLVTINRGFGGSQLADSVQFIDRIVLKHKPQAVVMYAGDNDLNAGKSPERVFADFAEFVAILHKQLPNTTLHYVAVKPSISRWKLVGQVRRTNALIKSYCELHDKLFFVDIDSPMLDEVGKLRPELFLADGLHLSELGYQIWNAKVLESFNQAGGLATPLSDFKKKRIIVLTDITNEPDDEQSMVRFLCYVNQFDVEGLIATTSCWLRDQVVPAKISERIDAYGKVRPNLLKHAQGWPTAQHLHSVVKTSTPRFGMEGVGQGQSSSGSKLIIEAVDRPDPRPVYVSIWGGANCLAQAIWEVQRTRTPAEVKIFVSKIRAYSISDQDDSGHWMRNTFPNLFYVVSPGYEENNGHGYRHASWNGISGDKFHGKFSGADFSIVDNPWLDENIRNNHGPLGALHPQTKYLMEGDTPSFFWLIDNGLNEPRHPNFGGWGGRYELYSPVEQNWHYEKETRPIWTDAFDTVTGVDNQTYRSNQATIWRWREAYQNDFAARMNWTTTDDFKNANHSPKIVVNSDNTSHPIYLTAPSGKKIEIEFSANDPDDDQVTFNVFQYQEAGTYGGPVNFTQEDSSITLTAPQVSTPKTIHFIVEATDNGAPQLTSYRRVVLNVEPKGFRKQPDQRPRVFITTDISDGEGDPDDRQSLCHLLYYVNELDIRGIVPDRFSESSKRACDLACDRYEQDYGSPWTRYRQYEYPNPSDIRALMIHDRETALSQLIAEANKKDARPLYVLAWGNLKFVREALDRDPRIEKKIRLLTIGTFKKSKADDGDGEQMNWNGDSRNVIYNNHLKLWWLENDWTYNGMFAGDEPIEMKEWLSKNGGQLGRQIEEVIDTVDWADNFRAGDTPTVLYLLDPNHNPSRPDRPGWAGEFHRPFPESRPNYWTDICGENAWNYSKPEKTWQNADAVMKTRVQTLLVQRPEMYDALKKKVADLYGTEFAYAQQTELANRLKEAEKAKKQDPENTATKKK